MLKLLYSEPHQIPAPIIAEARQVRKYGDASACADIEQSRVRKAIVPVLRYRCIASLQKKFFAANG
jgi:hypothetical protein